MTRALGRPTLAIVGAFALMLFIGCTPQERKYAISHSGKRTYLINQETGELKMIDETALLEVKARDQITPPAATLKEWPDESPVGTPGVTIKIRTKYRDGHLQYVANASPFEGPISKAFSAYWSEAKFSMKLLDSDGFELSDAIDLPIAQSSRIIGESGKPERLQWSGSLAMSYDKYKTAVRIQMGWQGFGGMTKQ